MSRWITRAAGPAVAAVLSVTLAGCNNTPGLSNGSVSDCFRAIPKAITASGDSSAHLIGVHRIPADRVKQHLPASVQAALQGEGDNDTTVCAIALKGTFNPGQVALAPPAAHGNYALVLVTSRHLDVVASYVLDHLPTSFGKRTL